MRRLDYCAAHGALTEPSDHAREFAGLPGAWFLRVNLMGDELALQKHEISEWDAWRQLPVEDKVLGAEMLAECDRIAEATKGDSR